MGKRIFFSFAAVLCMLFAVMASALTGHDPLKRQDLAQWMTLPQGQKIAVLEALMAKHRGALSTSSVESCIEKQAKIPGFAAYSVATAYSTCAFKLSN